MPRLPASQREIVIAANPKSGRTRRNDLVGRLEQELRQRGFSPRVCWDLTEMATTASQLHAAGNLRCVVAAGGDGTAATVAERTPPEVVLSLLPLGTENLLAKYLGIHPDPIAVATMIEEGEWESLDAGLANGRLFLLMASVGFDSHVVDQVHRQRRGHIHQWTYAWPILSAIFRYSFPRLRWSHQDRRDDVAWFFAFNLPRYAQGLPFAPWADGHDGLLDLCTFSRGGVWKGLQYWYHLRQGKHVHLADFHTERVARVTIEADSQVPYQTDGDAGGYLPLTLEAVPNRLRVLRPAQDPKVATPS